MGHWFANEYGFYFRHLLLVERTSLSLYNFEGRLLSSPRWASLNTATLNPSHITLGPECIAARDQADDKGNCQDLLMFGIYVLKYMGK